MTYPITVEWSPSTSPADASDWVPFPRGAATGKTKRGRGSGYFDEYQPGTVDIEVPNLTADGVPIIGLDDFLRWQRFRVLADFVGNPPAPIISTYITEVDHDLDALPVQARVTVKGTEAPGVWNRGTLSLDTNGDPLPTSFLGFPYTIAELIDLIDSTSGTVIGSVNPVGDARAPVTLPATITEEETIPYGRYSGNQWDTLRKALDVELGTVHITPDNDIAYNGRYAVPVAYADGGDLLYFSGLETPTNPDAYRILKTSLKMANTMAEYRNAARVQGLSKLLQSVDRIPTGYPVDAIERLDTWTIDDNWTKANAELLANLYTGAPRSWPTEIAVLCWTPEQSLDSPRAQMAYAIQNATTRLGITFASIEFQLPGGAPRTYLATIESIAWTFKNDAVFATIGLGASAARWNDAYPDAMTAGIFTLDDPDRGLDSAAILGP